MAEPQTCSRFLLTKLVCVVVWGLIGLSGKGCASPEGTALEVGEDPDSGIDSTTPAYTTTSATSTTAPGLSFAGISSAISFREGEVDIAWLSAEDQEGNQEGIEYFLLYGDGELNLSESDVQSLASQTFDTLNASVLSLGDKQEAVLRGLEPKSVVSLLVLAKGPQGEVSDNRRVTKVAIAAKSPELAENVTMLSLMANSSLHIKAMRTNISIITTGIELPLVVKGMCLTGTDSDGTAFLAFVDDVSSLGSTLVATTHDAALTEVFRTLQLDATMDFTGGDRDAGSRRLAVKGGVQVTENVHMEFAQSIAIDPSFEVQFPGWHFAVDIDWTGINSLEVTAGLAWSLGVDLKYAGMSKISYKLLGLPIANQSFGPWFIYPPAVFLRLVASLDFEAEVSVSQDLNMQYRGQFWQTQTVHVSFRDGEWDTRHEDSGLQQKREFLEEVKGTVETSVKVSFSLLAQLSGLVGFKFALSPGMSLGMTVAYDTEDSFLQKEAPMKGAHVEALGVSLTLGLGVTLECSDAVAWVLSKLCSYIKAIDLYKWDATPVPVLSLPSLQLVQEGCSAQALPSRAEENEEYRWLLDSEALQITGTKQEAEVDLELIGSLANLALGSWGKIYVFWQPFPFVQIMESVELTAWELAWCTATTTSTSIGSSSGEGGTPAITSPPPGEAVCGYQEITSCQMQLAMSVNSASKVCETVQGALGCYSTSNCCDAKYGMIDVPAYLDTQISGFSVLNCDLANPCRR